jgi:hypothetical protein
MSIYELKRRVIYVGHIWGYEEQFFDIFARESCKNACTVFIYHMCLSTAIKGNYCIHLLILFPRERTVACVIEYDVHFLITFI